MDISIQKLLQKMDEELQIAMKSGHTSHVREHVQAIKTLCELVLDQPSSASQTMTVSRPATIEFTPQPMRTVIAEPPARKIELDEANGDSLLDF